MQVHSHVVWGSVHSRLLRDCDRQQFRKNKSGTAKMFKRKHKMQDTQGDTFVIRKVSQAEELAWGMSNLPKICSTWPPWEVTFMSLLLTHCCLLPGQIWKLQVTLCSSQGIEQKTLRSSGRSNPWEGHRLGDEFSEAGRAILRSLRVDAAKPGCEDEQVSRTTL